MIWPGTIISERLRGIGADEDRAGIADSVDPAIRIGKGKLKVLRGNAIGNVARLIQIIHQNQCATVLQRATDNLSARHGRQELLDRAHHSIDVSPIWTEQDGLRQFVMLCLREQVHGHPVRIRLAVTYHQDF